MLRIQIAFQAKKKNILTHWKIVRKARHIHAHNMIGNLILLTTRIVIRTLSLTLTLTLTRTLSQHFDLNSKNGGIKSNKLYRFWKKLRFNSFARGINCERLDRMPPPICKSLNVSSRITAKLLVRRKLHVSDLLIVSKVCSIRSYIDSTLSAATKKKQMIMKEQMKVEMTRMKDKRERKRVKFLIIV